MAIIAATETMRSSCSRIRSICLGTACRPLSISVARRDYIDAVRSYNTEIRTFPSIIWAKTVFGSKPMAEFAANEGAQAPPTVKF